MTWYNISINSIDKDFYKRMLSIALPVALQNLIMTAVNMLDTFMIGQLGEISISAVSLANQVFFVFSLFLFGVASSSTIFISQFWGNKDGKSVRKIVGITLLFGIVVSIAFGLLSILFPRNIMDIFSNDIEVINLGSKYLKIVATSFIFTAISFSFVSSLKAVDHPQIGTLLSVVTLFINGFLNYVLIFGNLGFPKLGVEGAAIATTIARIVEVILVVSISKAKKFVVMGRIKDYISFSISFLKRYLKTASTVIANEAFWGTGVAIQAAIFGNMGYMAQSSVYLSQVVDRLAFVFFIGVANASAVMIGNLLGRDEFEKAKDYSRKFFKTGFFISILTMVLVLLLAKPMLGLFNISNQVYDAAIKVVFIAAVIQPLKLFNFINIVGVLRSGGDTKFCLFLDFLGMYMVGIPIALILAFVFRLEVYYVYLFVIGDELIKAILGFIRYKKFIWARNMIKGMH